MRTEGGRQAAVTGEDNGAGTIGTDSDPAPRSSRLEIGPARTAQRGHLSTEHRELPGTLVPWVPQTPDSLWPELVLLGLQVAPGVLRGGNFERHRFDDRQPVALDAHELARVVGQQPHRADAEVAQDLRADAVVALVGLEAEPLVGLDRVEALVLQLVGADLVRPARCPALPGSGRAGRRAPRSAMRCIAASSCAPQSQRAEWNTSPVRHFECTRTSTSLAVADLAADQRHVRLAVELALEGVDAEVAVLGRQLRRRDPLDQRSVRMRY